MEEADKLRLVLLFALRYEKDGRPQIMQLLKQLQVRAVLFGLAGDEHSCWAPRAAKDV